METVRLHDLRHYVATTLLASGTDLATVAGRLGHGSGGKTTLAIYGYFLRGAAPDRAAAELFARLVRPGAAGYRRGLMENRSRHPSMTASMATTG